MRGGGRIYKNNIHFGMLTESKPSPLATRQAIELERRGVEARKTLIWGLADQEEGRPVPKITILLESDGLYRSERN